MALQDSQTYIHQCVADWNFMQLISACRTPVLWSILNCGGQASLRPADQFSFCQDHKITLQRSKRSPRCSPYHVISSFRIRSLNFFSRRSKEQVETRSGAIPCILLYTTA